jgi:nicotinamidase-related amidase
MNLALMIIDMQKAYAVGYCKESMEKAALAINQTILLFRQKNKPIFWVQDINQKEGVLPGTDGFGIIDCLLFDSSDRVIYKESMNAFADTKCAEVLRENGIDTILVAGFCADYCIISTYKGALNEGFTAALLKGGSAAGKQQDIDSVELECDTVSLPFLTQLIGFPLRPLVIK